MTPAKISRARELRSKGGSLRSIGRALRVSPSTVSRALRADARGRAPNPALRHSAPLGARPPRRRDTIHSWSLERIRAARDAQLRGDFYLPAKLAEASRTDDAVFVSYHARVAPQAAIGTQVTPKPGQLGERVAKKLRNNVTTAREVMQGIQGTMANHGVAFGYLVRELDAYGATISLTLKEWPIEHVKWSDADGAFITQTSCGEAVKITHGDGFWVVFSKFGEQPWKQEACILPIALVWGAHANGLKDWAGSSASHGSPRVVGEMAEGVTLEDEAGQLSPEAQAFLSMLLDVVTGEAAAGVRPSGARTEFLSNGSTAWQVFKELIENRERAAARIYLGTDAILGAQSGAPGVDISALFGVASTKLQGDFLALENGINSGVYAVWTALHYTTASPSPCLTYLMPDTDSERKSEEQEKKRERLFAEVERRRGLGFTVDQEVVNDLARVYDVSPVPVLAESQPDPAPAPSGAEPLA